MSENLLANPDLLIKGYERGGENMLKRLLELNFDVLSLNDQKKAILWNLVVAKSDRHAAKLLVDFKVTAPFDRSDFL